MVMVIFADLYWVPLHLLPAAPRSADLQLQGPRPPVLHLPGDGDQLAGVVPHTQLSHPGTPHCPVSNIALCDNQLLQIILTAPCVSHFQQFGSIALEPNLCHCHGGHYEGVCQQSQRWCLHDDYLHCVYYY